MIDVAAFDLDGTITTGDTLLPFLRRLRGARPLAGALVRSAGPLAARERDAVKAALIERLLTGYDPDELAAAADAHADAVLVRRLRPAVRARVAHHREAGHLIVVVTASPELIVRRWAPLLDADLVIGTRLGLGDDGRLSGRIEGLNNRGQAKVDRLASDLPADSALAFAYGNSADDVPMLRAAREAWMVRGRRIRPFGPARG